MANREEYKKLVPMSRNEELLMEIVDAINNSGGGGGGSITVDDALSETSTNPVQNKVVTSALKERPDTQEINTVVDEAVGKVLDENIATDHQVDNVISELNDL